MLGGCTERESTNSLASTLISVARFGKQLDFYCLDSIHPGTREGLGCLDDVAHLASTSGAPGISCAAESTPR